MAAIAFLLCLCLIHTTLAKGSEPLIECTPEILKVTVPMDGDRKVAYLDQMKEYKPCLPEMDNNTAVFVLDLLDFSKCGVMKILNTVTGKKTFSHIIVIERTGGVRETVAARCEVKGKQRVLRDVGPFPLDDFDEPEVVNITRSAEGHAPEPVLGAVVKQNGKKVSGEISVSPGTPLSMEIFLNEVSAPVFGLLVTYMHVTDTGKQQETIILNGCSVDPYLFDNFLTNNGDVLTAKFRAFKFPDSTYVQFKGTVTVCVDKCQGEQCSNGVVGYGRRRRSVISARPPNHLYEVSLTTFIKVDYQNKDANEEAENVLALLKNLKVANQRLGDVDGTPATVAEQTQDNKLVLHDYVAPLVHGKSSAVPCSLILVLFSMVVSLLK